MQPGWGGEPTNPCAPTGIWLEFWATVPGCNRSSVLLHSRYIDDFCTTLKCFEFCNFHTLIHALYNHIYNRKKIFKIQVCLFFFAIFCMHSIFNLPYGPCYNVTFHSILHLHAQNFITFKMSYNLLNSDRKYVSSINFTGLTCFGIDKIVFLENLQSSEIYLPIGFQTRIGLSPTSN